MYRWKCGVWSRAHPQTLISLLETQASSSCSHGARHAIRTPGSHRESPTSVRRDTGPRAYTHQEQQHSPWSKSSREQRQEWRAATNPPHVSPSPPATQNWGLIESGTSSIRTQKQSNATKPRRLATRTELHQNKKGEGYVNGRRATRLQYCEEGGEGWLGGQQTGKGRGAAGESGCDVCCDLLWWCCVCGAGAWTNGSAQLHCGLTTKVASWRSGRCQFVDHGEAARNIIWSVGVCLRAGHGHRHLGSQHPGPPTCFGCGGRGLPAKPGSLARLPVGLNFLSADPPAHHLQCPINSLELCAWLCTSRRAVPWAPILGVSGHSESPHVALHYMRYFLGPILTSIIS